MSDGQPEITFYHAPQTRSVIVRWMLEELGVPYQVERIDLASGEHRKPAYLTVNPMGKVPALAHRGVVVTEAAAICAYLADTFPHAGLAPPIGDPRRGLYCKWLFFGPGCLEPAMADRMFKREPAPARALGYGDYDTTLDVVTRAVAPGPYLLDDRFTAADIVIGSTLRWGMMVGAVPERPEIVAYTNRLAERPALQRTQAKDAELAASLAG
jgi:glutathione S-transferase